MESKLELRAFYQAQVRNVLKQKSAADYTPQFEAQLLPFLKKQKPGSWSAFRPMATEPAITSILKKVSHLIWYFPRITSSGLEFVQSEEFAKSEMGFHEPMGKNVIPAEKLDGFLVPGLAFDHQGHRLGRGKSFYDRALKGLQALKVAVCYEQQIHHSVLPVEDHDISMDILVTNEKMRPIQQERIS